MGGRDVWRALAEVDGFEEGASVFGSDDQPAYFVNGTQVAHVRDGRLELRLTRDVIRAHRERLRSDPRVTLSPRRRDWVSVDLGLPADRAAVLELAELAAQAHRPPPGVPPLPPPTGAELDRRRRWH